MDEPPSILRRHVEAFNAGVRSGDFRAIIEGFADDAVLVFEGAPLGPFDGRAAIAAAYDDRPPDDEIDVLDAREADGTIEALYGWRREAGRPAGRMILTPVDDRIARLVVTFETDATIGS